MPSLLNTVRDLDRLRQIVTVLARHGFGEVVQRAGLSALASRSPVTTSDSQVSVGARIRLVLQDLGPSFVKLGQIASTRPDLLPPDVIAELQKLQDEVPPVPFAELKVELEEQLGGSVSEVFEVFEESPLASASIGQAHQAKLSGPEGPIDVVVKIQRPNIRAVIERDIDLLYWLAHAIERSMPESRIYCPVRMVSEFDRAISSECDYGQEADNAERFRANFATTPSVTFPSVFRQASSKKVLTLSFLPGRNVFEAVREGASGEVIARNALAVMMKMIFEHGFFHADPHPGNVLIQGDPSSPVIGLIDLGLVGRLSPKLRDKTIDLVLAAAREDHRAVVDALCSIGTATKPLDRDGLEARVAQLSHKYVGKQLKDLELSSLVRDLASTASQFGLEIPPDFLLVARALTMVEGIGKQIHPQLDVLEEIKPYFTELLLRRYAPEKISGDLLRMAGQLTSAASDVPAYTQEVLHDLRQGRLSFQVHNPSLNQVADRLGRRVFSGLVASALIGSGAFLIAKEQLLAGAGFLFASVLTALFYAGLLTFSDKR
ncbi:MAG: AarF/UbiB family protein [Proteobacteria bacterium]|nr:AarF/UbiB family protein [Pseudomonadota bacterium]